MNKWKLLSGLGGLVLVLAIAGVWLFGGTAVASASERATDDLKALTQSTTGPGLLGDGFLAHGGRGGRGGFMFPGKGSIDYRQLLADALGITIEELQAAREQANQAAIAQAIEEGIITQEQADQMQARQDLQSYLDREAVMAGALGMTVEELQAALGEGKTFRDLLSERELDPETMRENMQAAFEAAIVQAVEDGVITQEQADAMKDGTGWGFGPMGRRGLDRENLPAPEDWSGKDGFRGRGGFGGRVPWNPNTDDTSGTGFRRPGRALQDASAL